MNRQQKNIGDPASFMKLYDVDEEEKYAAKAIQEKRAPEELSKELDSNIDFPQ